MGLNVGMLDIKILLISCMVFQNLSLWISSKYLFYYKEFVSQKNNFNAQSLNKCALYTSLFKANIVEAKFKFKSKLKTKNTNNCHQYPKIKFKKMNLFSTMFPYLHKYILWPSTEHNLIKAIPHLHPMESLYYKSGMLRTIWY